MPDEPKIVSLKEAREQSLKFYFTGKPCKHGHIAFRKVVDRSCVECNREKSRRHASSTKKWREENKDRDAENKQKYYREHREEYLERSKQERTNNPEKQRGYKRKWRRSKKGLEQSRRWVEENREKHNENVKKWKRKNPAKVLANTRKRQTALMNRLPPWVANNKKMLDQIEAFYEEARRLTKRTGIMHHVDHIVPLQGEEVSGLHVPWNLQILTESENCSKWNRV